MKLYNVISVTIDFRVNNGHLSRAFIQQMLMYTPVNILNGKSRIRREIVHFQTFWFLLKSILVAGERYLSRPVLNLPDSLVKT